MDFKERFGLLVLTSAVLFTYLLVELIGVRNILLVGYGASVAYFLVGAFDYWKGASK